MLVVHGSDALSTPPSGARAVAIGNFDGVHLGHRHVLAELAQVAGAAGLPTWVYTFDPAPTAVLVPERHQPRLMSLARKLELLDALGLDGVVVEPFTRAFAGLSGQAFAEQVLWERLRARAVVVGWDFRFGSGRGGDAAALRAALPDARVEQVGPLLVDGTPVSSSRIRGLITGGQVDAAAALLGRPHRLTGRVVHGDARGRTIGFPTANLVSDVECLPAAGVYVVEARIDGVARRGVMNLGMRPTFDGRELRIEVHVLDWSGDLYGRTLEVDVLRALRGELRFPSVDALVAQIHADVALARTLP